MALCALNQVAKFATSDRVLWGAIGTAALFLLHPVNAEAIAWVKYVLLACVVAIVVSSPFGVAAGPALLLDFCRRRQSSKADAVAVLRDCRELAVLSLAIPRLLLLAAGSRRGQESRVHRPKRAPYHGDDGADHAKSPHALCENPHCRILTEPTLPLRSRAEVGLARSTLWAYFQSPAPCSAGVPKSEAGERRLLPRLPRQT